MGSMGSLSARRAWIEIANSSMSFAASTVALRKESVDRNMDAQEAVHLKPGRSPQGERG